MSVRTAIAKGLYITLFMFGCGGGEPLMTEQSFEVAAGEEAFAGHGDSKLLSVVELATYHADRKYVRSLMKRGVAMAINHADPRQHRFAVARMKLAAKTPENSPELFRQMDQLQAAHAARGLVAGQMQPAVVDDGSLQSQHQMLVTGRTPQPGKVQSGAMASRRDELSYGYVDCNVYDGEGNALGDTAFNEVFGDLTYFTPRCDGDSSLAVDASLEGDSFLTETVLKTGVTNQHYMLGEVVANGANDPTLTLPTIIHPQDPPPPPPAGSGIPYNGVHDGKVVVCLDRSDGTCEYFLSDPNRGVNDYPLKLPLQGRISITNGNFDENKIGQYQRGQVDSGSQIFVTLGDTHGGCSLPQSSQTFSMKDFWNSVTYTPTQISWDLYSNGKWAAFSNTCRLVQNRVDLTMTLYLPYTAPGIAGSKIVEISTASPETAPNYQMPYYFQILNSCLAAGTRISSGAGVARPIEDFHVGDAVANPYANTLSVADLSVGIERSPMVHIVDSRGHELLMTEKHPLYVVDRGMVAAVQLKTGDPIKTVDGPAILVSVTRESYNGNVYNLKLGNAAEARRLGADQTVMYANGILVGDSQIQTRHELMELRAQTRHEPLPGRWRTDYLSSRERAHTVSSAR